jgi:cytochrome c oxidase subunit 3
MIVAAVFLSFLAAAAAYFVMRADLAAKPWLQQGVIGDLSDPETRKAPAAKTGLIFFLAVVGSLFALLASAYVMRAGEPDWRSAPMPPLLWINTGLLILSSLALQASVHAARRGQSRIARFRLLMGAAAALAFLVGQLLAWREFAAAGYFLSTNPANSFFYLITGLHGAHLAGGVAALAATVVKARGDVAITPERRGLELCALYWHFLLIVWLIMFALLMGWGGDIVAICRRLVS